MADDSKPITEEAPLIAGQPVTESYGGAQPAEQQQPAVQQEMLTGPYYSDEVEKKLTGQMSDGLFDCLSDSWTCFICSLPFIGCACLLYDTVSRLPVKFRQMTLCGCSTPLGGRRVIKIQIPFNVASLFLVGGSIVHYLSVAVYTRYNVTPPPSFVQSWLCQACQLARLARHTGRAQGFLK